MTPNSPNQQSNWGLDFNSLANT